MHVDSPGGRGRGKEEETARCMLPIMIDEESERTQKSCRRHRQTRDLRVVGRHGRYGRGQPV